MYIWLLIIVIFLSPQAKIKAKENVSRQQHTLQEVESNGFVIQLKRDYINSPIRVAVTMKHPIIAIPHHLLIKDVASILCSSVIIVLLLNHTDI